MHIANTIYNVVFKFTTEDEKVAKNAETKMIVKHNSWKYLFICYLLSFATLPTVGRAQGDSLALADDAYRGVALRRTDYTGLIAPAALVAYGVAAQVSPMLKQFDHYVGDALARPGTRVDDYLQYAPVAATLALGMTRLKARSNLRDRAFVALSSHLIMSASVRTIKHTIKVRRPDSFADNSFPSGHTATAFTGAHLLAREYGGSSAWIGVAGYAAATATGVIRIVNSRHWLSDVVAGAGVGILSVEAGYALLPLFRRLMGDEAPALAITPLAGAGMYGMGLAFCF
ncbi:MAG: phosphatase PAP2 family protein [Tannerellaceae bacterium]|jgi:membrane-associated phospholipid phosphatase|nr:phosphatase PAP2 family protein [Tannerellaceae bacterium]